jgi:RNA polymerase sigma-70 factor, ECF subfamily
MAVTITSNPSLARELADSLWAELFWTKTDQNGRRLSKLSFYSGRGSLEGWLRASLAQEYVKRFRTNRRFMQLDNETDTANARLTKGDAISPADPRVDRTLEQAVAELKGEERLLLASYYLDERSLAEIGVMLSLHESTVSRRLTKTIRRLRKRILHYLRAGCVDQRQAEELIQVDVRQISVDIRGQLLPVKDAL